MTKDEQQEAMASLREAWLHELPGVLRGTFDGMRREIERLTVAACDPAVSDEEFRRIVRDFEGSLPDLVQRTNPAVLADALERAMGTAMAIGYGKRQH